MHRKAGSSKVTFAGCDCMLKTRMQSGVRACQEHKDAVDKLLI